MDQTPPQTPASALPDGFDLRLLDMIVDLISAVSQLRYAVAMLSIFAPEEVKAQVKVAADEAGKKRDAVMANMRRYLEDHG